MSIIVPHHVVVRRHSDIPYLWRARCTCGWYALAPTEERARAARTQHIYDEEPFPNLFDPEENTDAGTS